MPPFNSVNSHLSQLRSQPENGRGNTSIAWIDKRNSIKLARLCTRCVRNSLTLDYVEIVPHNVPNPGLILQARRHHGPVDGASPQIPPPQHPGLSRAILNHALVCPPHPTPYRLPWLSSRRTTLPSRQMARGDGGARSRPRQGTLLGHAGRERRRRIQGQGHPRKTEHQREHEPQRRPASSWV
jgi:hypothetical protein